MAVCVCVPVLGMIRRERVRESCTVTEGLWFPDPSRISPSGIPRVLDSEREDPRRDRETSRQLSIWNTLVLFTMSFNIVVLAQVACIALSFRLREDSPSFSIVYPRSLISACRKAFDDKPRMDSVTVAINDHCSFHFLKKKNSEILPDDAKWIRKKNKA